MRADNAASLVKCNWDSVNRLQRWGLMATARKLPLEFRKDEVDYIAQRWKAGVSSSVVGLGSVGKSNFIQHLMDAEVQAHYLGAEAEKLKTIVIDSNMLGPLPSPGPESEQLRCWAGYELLMHRLFLAFYPFDMLEADDARRFYAAYQSLQDGSNPLYAYMSLRYFELGLEFFFRIGHRIIFLFDEFDELLRILPVKFFQTLRGVRDLHKHQLQFVTFTRSPLPLLVERLSIDPLAIEPFAELFTDNVLYLGPYSEKDGRRMVEELGRRRGQTHSEHVLSLLMGATGRYAGLLRAGFNLLETLGSVNMDEQSVESFASLLAAKMPMRTECMTIWTSLSPSEQVVLKAVARLAPYNVTAETELAVTMLVQKKLLRLNKTQQKLEIEPPVFRAFIAEHPDQLRTGA